MRELNINFQEKYKSVDSFIKGAFGTSEGVSEYIREMEFAESENRLYQGISTWNSDYRHLKRSRWIRNQLAHEVSIDSDICLEEDYDWLCDFRVRLYDGDDSLACYTRETERYLKKLYADSRRRDSDSNDSEKDYHISFQYDPDIPEEPDRNNGAWVFLLIPILIVVYFVLKMLRLISF